MTDTYEQTDQSPADEPRINEPPHDVRAEQALIGSMLLNTNVTGEQLARINVDDFYRPAHQDIYSAVYDMYARGEPADSVTLATELEKRKWLRRIGGAPYLLELIAMVPTTANAGYYANIVVEKAKLRKLIAAATRAIQYANAGHDGGADVDQVISLAQQEMFDVANTGRTDDFVTLDDLLDSVADDISSASDNGGARRGVLTGFTELDTTLNGLRPQQMVVIAARPGVGKSALATNVLHSCAVTQRLPAALFSLEMSRSEIVMRLLSAATKIRVDKLPTGQLSPDEWARIARRMSEITDAPLYVDDSPNLSMMQIRSKARRLKQRVDLRLIVVDYMQLMSSGKRHESRQTEVSEISRQLKLLAKELEVPVVALSQLNRGPEQRTDKKPMLSDLRESGAIEQDSDVVILMYRPDAYDRDSPNRGETEFIVAKNRNGQCKSINVESQLQYARFINTRTDFA